MVADNPRLKIPPPLPKIVQVAGKMKTIDENGCLLMVGEIVGILEGISVNQAKWVLEETEQLLLSTHAVDKKKLIAVFPGCAGVSDE